jgi:hypothetical protein
MLCNKKFRKFDTDLAGKGFEKFTINIIMESILT